MHRECNQKAVNSRPKSIAEVSPTTNGPKPRRPAIPAWHSRFSVFLRTLSLKVIPSLTHVPEKPKVAIRRSRRDAAIRCVVHVMPLIGAVILFSMNLSWYWVGASFSPGGRVALQFAAKLHELTMVSSLSTTLLSYIRFGLMSDTGVPFGTALVGFQITQPTYLWSSDFLGSIRSKHYSFFFKIRLIIAILVTLSLASTLGPASAACMIPREANWPYGRAKSTVNFQNRVGVIKNWSINRTVDEIYPTRLPLTTPYYDYDKSMPYTEDALLSILGPAFQSLVTDAQRVTSATWFGFMQGRPTPMTLSLATIIDTTRIGATTSTQSQNFVYLGASYINIIPGAEFDIQNTMDPYSKVECYSSQTSWVTDPLPTLDFTSASAISYTVSNYLTKDELASLEKGVSRNITTLAERKQFDIYFVNFTDTMVGVVHTAAEWRPNGSEVNHPRGEVQVVFTPCTFEFGWYASDFHWHGTQARASSQGPPSASAQKLRKVEANQEWLARVNPHLGSRNSSLFAELAKPNYYKLSISSAVSVLLTTALSNASPRIERWDFVMTWASGKTSRVNESVAQSFPSQFPIKVTIPGFGYGPNDTLVILSLVLLLIHCVITTAHVVWSLWTGISSSAWDSISEIVALAINSRPAIELQNACVGIQRMDIFANRVKIASTDQRSSEDDSLHLELLFPSSDGRHASQIVPNQAYGAVKEFKYKTE